MFLLLAASAQAGEVPLAAVLVLGRLSGAVAPTTYAGVRWLVPRIAPPAELFLLGGLLWGPYTTIEATALQRWVDPSRHGGVFGLQRSLLAIATPLGAAAGALALGHLSPGLVLLLSAAACAAAGALALIVPDLRRTG